MGDRNLRRIASRALVNLRKLRTPELTADLTPPALADLIDTVRSDLAGLCFDPQEGMDALYVERELAKLSAQVCATPSRLQGLFSLELRWCELWLSPSDLACGGPIRDGFKLPTLERIRSEKNPSDQIWLPEACSEAAEACASLANAALADGTIDLWSIQDCEIVLRLLLINSLLCKAGEDVAQGAQIRFGQFANEGMKLWDALAARMDWQSDAGAIAPLWDRPLRLRVLKTLRHQCYALGSPQPKRVGARVGLDEVWGAGKDADIGSALDELFLVLDEGAAAGAPGFVRVITTPIPPATCREDRDAIAQYAALQEPVPVAPLPPAQELVNLLQAQQAEFPWAEAICGLLRERLVTASLLGVRELHLPPVLLVGPPGCGKSRFLRRLAQRLQLPYLPLSLAGASDTKLLAGTSRGWASGDASPLVRLLLQHRSASAFVVLDELDKLNRNGEASAALGNLLLGLLEPETASSWRDGYLQATCDLSRVIFWGTANSLEGIGRPLLSRMDLVVMRSPSAEHLPGIAAGLAADLELQWHLPAGTLPAIPEAVWSVGADNLRTMRRALHQYLYQWVREQRPAERMH